MNIDFVEIVKKTWSIVSKRPYFWLVGILVGSSGGLSVSFNLPFWRGGNNQVFTQSNDFYSFQSQIADFIQSNWSIILIVLLILFLIGLIFLILSFTAKAGLIKTIWSIEKNRKESNFFSTIGSGFEYFWRVFGLSILAGLVTAVLIGLFITPVFIESFLPLLFFGWFMIASILVIAGAIFVEIYYIISVRELVVNNLGIGEAIRNSWQIIKKYIGQIILGLLVFYFVGLILGVAFTIVSLTYILISALLVWLASILSSTAAIIFGIFLGLVLTLSILILIGFLSSFKLTYWTLIYDKIQLKKAK